MTIEAKLEPGWLKRQMDDIEALERANRKIIEASRKCRRNGYTQPYELKLTIAELNALAYMARCSGVVGCS